MTGKDKLGAAMEKGNEAAEQEAEDRFSRADKHWSGGQETGAAQSYNPSTGRKKKQVILSLSEDERELITQIQERANSLKMWTPNRSQTGVAAFEALLSLPDEQFEQAVKSVVDRDRD